MVELHLSATLFTKLGNVFVAPLLGDIPLQKF